MFLQKADITVVGAKGKRSFSGVTILEKESRYLVLCTKPEKLVDLCMKDAAFAKMLKDRNVGGCINYLQIVLSNYVERPNLVEDAELRAFLNRFIIHLNPASNYCFANTARIEQFKF